jgi:zinc transport system ATP-binding protein
MQALATPSAGTVVELVDVGVDYHQEVHALEHITLNIQKGDFVGLIGPNGAGKSTLISIILGLTKPTTGTVKLFGEPVSSKNLKRVGYVPQVANPKDRNFPSTVYETVMMGRIPHSSLFPWFTDKDHKKVEDMMSRLDIEHVRDRRIGELSGGESQRVFTAKALVGDPELLILDEPTSGADIHVKSEFYDILGRMNKELEITTILSLHDISAVTKIAKTIVCINRTLYFDGPTREFRASSILPKAYNYPIEVIEHGEHP